MNRLKSFKTKLINPIKYIWQNKSQKKIWIPAVIIVLLLPMLFGNAKDSEVYTYKIEPKEFIQNVSLTGKIIAAKNVDMAFEVSGRVNKVNFKIGDRVKKGQVIASLQNGDVVANLQKNSAKLREIQNGARPEELAIAEGDLIGAKNDFNLSKQILENEAQNLYDKADDAIRFKIDNAFYNPRSVNPLFMYSIDQNAGLKDKINNNRLEISDTLDLWKKDLTNQNYDVNKIKVYATEVQSFINDISSAMSVVAEKSNSTDANYTTIQNQKADILLARTNFNTAINAFSQAQLSYKNSLTSLNRAENDLKIKQIGGTNEEVIIQRADVQNAEALLQRTLIVAPFDGIISKLDVKEGEISSPNTPVVSILNDGEYQIETFVSENDIAKLQIGQIAKVSLDAYSRDVFFNANIISIDPAETIKDGVSTYRTKIQFTDRDERIKSGMTANIDIETDRRQDVIFVPQSAYFLDKGVKKVYVLKDDSCTKNIQAGSCDKLFNNKSELDIVEIKTGEINNTGDIEIVSGLNLNQTIIYGKKN